MQVLEDHNRQLEAQLQRLRQLLDQVQREFTIKKWKNEKNCILLIQKTFYLSFWMQPGQDKQSGAQSSERTTPSSSISSLGDGPYSPGKTARSGKSRGNDSDSESEPGGTGPIVPGPVTNGFSSKGNEDPALKEVMSQISSSFPPDQKSEWGGTVKRFFVSWLMFIVSD